MVPKFSSYNVMAKIYHIIFNLVALSALIYIGIDVLYRFVDVKLKGVANEKVLTERKADVKQNKKEPLSYFNMVTDRNLFGSTQKEIAEQVKGPEVETLEPTSLKIVLLGTVTGNEKNTLAVIEETAKKRQDLYRVGDSIQNAIVKMILRGKVVLRVGDRDEILLMEESSSSKPEKGVQPPQSDNTEKTITVKRSDLDSSLKDINQILSTVRIRPHLKDGVTDGLVITRMMADSIFTRLGLKNGDIVQEINGNRIENPDHLLSMYNDMRSGSPISIQIIRGGQQQTLNYKFSEQKDQ